MSTTQSRAAGQALTRAASFGTADATTRTVEVVWSTGAKVLRSSWDGQFYEELAMEPGAARLGRLNGGAPFLADHDARSVAAQLGVVVEGSARIVNGRGVATVRFPEVGVDPRADMVFAKIAAGIIRNVSVGYFVWREEESSAADETIPTVRAVDWEPREISAVTIGADAGAQFREEETTNRKRGNNMSGIRQQPAEREAGIQQERERVSGIHAACRSASLEDAFAQRLIVEGVALDEARKRVLDELAVRSDNMLRTTPDRTPITAGDSHEDKIARAMTAALIHKMGKRSLIESAKAAKVEGFENFDLDGGPWRGAHVLDIARDAIEASGQRMRGFFGDRDRVLQVVAQRSASGQGFQSSFDFPNLLENALGKVLLAAYGLAPATWRDFTKVEAVSDFHDSNRYRVGALESLPVVLENAEYENAKIPDAEKYSISAETRGHIIALSRKALINDDLGAFANLGEQQGRAAAVTIEKAVYDLLNLNTGLGPTMGDGQPLFDASRKNVNGTGSALSVAGIGADMIVMAAQTDHTGNEVLDLKPEILLVPVGLEGTAKVINNSAANPDALNKINVANPVFGMFKKIVGTGRLTGTRRYLFADPNVAPVLIVAFLDGKQAPTLFSEEGFRVDGTQWKVRHDFKVNRADFRGAVTNAGA